MEGPQRGPPSLFSLIDTGLLLYVQRVTRKAKTKAEAITKIAANFPKDLWKELRHRALEDEETVTDILTRLSQIYINGKRRNDSRRAKNIR